MQIDLKDVAEMEMPITQEGKNMSTIFAPLKSVIKKIKEKNI